MDNPAEQDKRASYLELFFDLVFVFAITQLSALLREDVRFAGLAKGAFLLLILWWAWSLFTWTTNWTGAERLGVRIGLMGANGCQPDDGDSRTGSFCERWIVV